MSARQLILSILKDRGLRSLVHALLLEHFKVQSARNLEEGYRLIFGGQLPDLILIDTNFDQLQDIEQVNQLLVNNFTKHIPIILIAPEQGEQVSLPYQTTPHTHLLHQPIDLPLLHQTIYQVVS